ncbi:MAG: hypothetical protein ACLT9S_15905 [Faecalibacterium sp.]
MQDIHQQKRQHPCITPVPEGIEQQTGCDEPEIFCFPPGQKIMASQHDGQKQKQENYGAKNHFSATSAITETGS